MVTNRVLVGIFIPSKNSQVHVCLCLHVFVCVGLRQRLPLQYFAFVRKPCDTLLLQFLLGNLCWYGCTVFLLFLLCTDATKSKQLTKFVFLWEFKWLWWCCAWRGTSIEKQTNNKTVRLQCMYTCLQKHAQKHAHAHKNTCTNKHTHAQTRYKMSEISRTPSSCIRISLGPSFFTLSVYKHTKKHYT